jgi:hypothetical protein
VRASKNISATPE